jgi:hypothetical protein
MTSHVVYPGRKAGPPSPPRVRAAIARIVRAESGCVELLWVVVGAHSTIAAALQRRVSALAGAVDADVLEQADRLLSLACALEAACEAIEMESSEAAELRVDLAAIIAGCELIATAESFADHEADTIAA